MALGDWGWGVSFWRTFVNRDRDKVTQLWQRTIPLTSTSSAQASNSPSPGEDCWFGR